MKKFWPALLMAFALILPPDADARRMGGGKSFGQQSGNVSQRNATPNNNAPTQNAANPSAAKPAAAAPVAAPKKPWGAMLGGLAAGLGLAWLASSLGLGEGFGQILMFALLALAAFALFKMFMRSRSNNSNTARPAGGAPFAFQGAGAGAPAPDMASAPRNYSPDKVGNDASARPWERSSMAYDTAQPVAGAGAGGSMIGSALAGSQNWGVPEGFDVNGFVEAAKRNFHTLQAAWDSSDVSTLRSMMTDSMLDEIRGQLAERESHTGTEPNHTEVMMLEAQLLGIEDLSDSYMASVEFSGMIREDASSGPAPFREVWNMTKAKAGASGWLVAGVQALQ